MHLFVIGINHKTCPIEIRERLSITNSSYEAFNLVFSEKSNILEHVLLSTCNRTEIYVCAINLDQAIEHVLKVFEKFSCLNQKHFKFRMYIHHNEDMIAHLFRVHSGIDSLALGETEIAGQVKSAYEKALSRGWTGKYLNVLFQKSSKAAKRIRTETLIGQGKISIASISVDLAQKIFSKLHDKNILLIGSGEVARAVCESLSTRGVKNFLILNRNQERAQSLVADFGGKAMPFEELDQAAHHADILISSAGSPKAFIHPERVKSWMNKRRRESLFMIDLGVPRNIEKNVGEIQDIYLYNLDDLNDIASSNSLARKKSVKQAESIVIESSEYLNRRFKKMFAEENQSIKTSKAS